MTIQICHPRLQVVVLQLVHTLVDIRCMYVTYLKNNGTNILSSCCMHSYLVTGQLFNIQIQKKSDFQPPKNSPTSPKKTLPSFKGTSQTHHHPLEPSIMARAEFKAPYWIAQKSGEIDCVPTFHGARRRIRYSGEYRVSSPSTGKMDQRLAEIRDPKG